MNTDPNCIVSTNVKLKEIAQKLNTYKDIAGVCVVDKDGKLVNIITRHDISIRDIINLSLIGKSTD